MIPALVLIIILAASLAMLVVCLHNDLILRIDRLQRDIYQFRVDTANSLNDIYEQQHNIQHAFQNNARDDADQEDADWWKHQ